MLPLLRLGAFSGVTIKWWSQIGQTHHILGVGFVALTDGINLFLPEYLAVWEKSPLAVIEEFGGVSGESRTLP